MGNNPSGLLPVPWSDCRAAVWWVTAALWLPWPAVAYACYQVNGFNGVWASGLACCGCWVGVASALMVSWWANRWTPVVGLLGGSALRFFIPLAVAIAGTIFSPGFRQAGGFGIIVAYFLYSLVWETGLSLRLVRKRQTANTASRGHG